MSIQKIVTVSFVLFAMIVSNHSFAQENNLFQNDSPVSNEESWWERAYPQYSNNVGFTTSYFSGIGIHYKRYITREHSVKAVFWGWHSASEEFDDHQAINKKTSSILFSFGLEYQYCFFRKQNFSKNFALYGLAGARTWYEENKTPELYYSSDISNTNSLSLGLGFESRLGKHFVMNVDAGFARSWELERKWYSNNIPPRRNYTTKFSPVVGAGVGFVF